MTNRKRRPPPPTSESTTATPTLAAPAPLPTLRDFAETVDLMRRHQRTYFECRNAGSLAAAKRAERLVDEITRAILLNRAPEPTTRPLFDL